METSADSEAIGRGSPVNVTGPRACGREALLHAVRLSLGMSDRLHTVRDWEDVFRAAVAERCAPLAWIRCGAAIAVAAPPQVTARFRSHFAANAARISWALIASHKVASALEPMGVYPIMLKGPALAVRLYGESAARVCSDVDWFVPASMQARIHDVMVDEGWALVEGTRGGDCCYGRKAGNTAIYIETHSSLLHPRYAYLPLPAPSGKLTVIDGVPVIAHDDPLLVGYLCAHLATHRFAPLAWLIDLLELWDSLSKSARIEATRAAVLSGIDRYLRWALRRGALLSRAASGNATAAVRLGLTNAGRVEPHPMWRHIALAPGVPKMARAAWAWIAPQWVNGGRASAVTMTVSRVARHWRDALPTRHGLV